LGNVPIAAWLSQIRAAEPESSRWEPLETAAAGRPLARNWRAPSVRVSNTVFLSGGQTDEDATAHLNA